VPHCGCGKAAGQLQQEEREKTHCVTAVAGKGQGMHTMHCFAVVLEQEIKTHLVNDLRNRAVRCCCW
jgi:hypothetical protein